MLPLTTPTRHVWGIRWGVRIKAVLINHLSLTQRKRQIYLFTSALRPSGWTPLTGFCSGTWSLSLNSSKQQPHTSRVCEYQPLCHHSAPPLWRRFTGRVWAWALTELHMVLCRSFFVTITILSILRFCSLWTHSVRRPGMQFTKQITLILKRT